MIKDFIHEITSAEAHFSKLNPQTLHITVSGKASSSSHSKPRLVRRIYVAFPNDGIQEYDFFIDVPDGPVIEEFKILTATHSWVGFTQDLKAIKVISKTNKVVVKVQLPLTEQSGH